MTTGKAILLIVVGIAFEALAFTSKEFYASRGHGVPSNKPVPRWAGRLFFGVMGGAFILLGLIHLLFEL